MLLPSTVHNKNDIEEREKMVNNITIIFNIQHDVKEIYKKIY